MRSAHSSRVQEQRLAPEPPVRDSKTLSIPTPPVPRKKRKKLSPKEALANSKKLYEKPLPERQFIKRTRPRKPRGYRVRAARSGVHRDLEQAAQDLLRKELEGVTSHTAKKDILTPGKISDRKRREVPNMLGVPLPHIRSGLCIRVATQVGRLNSRDGVAQSFVSTGAPSFSWYGSTCWRCTQDIIPPDPISYDYDLDDWVHEECY